MVKNPKCSDHGSEAVVKVANVGVNAARWLCTKCGKVLGDAGKPDAKTIRISHSGRV